MRVTYLTKILIVLITVLSFSAVYGQDERPNPWAVNLPPKLQKRIEEKRKAREAENAAPVVVTTSGDTLPMRQMADTLPVSVRQYEVETYQDLSAPAPTVDLHDPDNVRTEVEYDPQTGQYIMHTRVGDMDITTPFSMSESEYADYSGRQAMQRYWHEKNNTGEHGRPKFDITDMKFNIGPADKVFGPGGVQVKLQGSAELKLGFNHTYTDNPSLTERARKSNVFDFDAKLQLNVNAKVGTKVAFNMNYNTEASFDFDQQNLKLAYKGEEDEIIKIIEAGNVQLPLNSSLIQGSQSLFGIRTELQFGKLNIQAIATQQRSESQNVSSKGGAQMTNFEISADSYDENRHFFLGYFFRDNYDRWMSTLPNVASGVVIKRIEVWITNKRANYEQARNIVAFTDLGEASPSHISNPQWHSEAGLDMQPRNTANNLYSGVKDSGIRDIQQTNSILETIFGGSQYGGTEYEKIESARMLSTSEYTLNASMGYISLRAALNPDEVLAVAYEYTYAGKTYQVGEFSSDAVQAPQALILKMLKNTTNSPSGTKGKGTWDLMMKNVYSLGASQMQADKFELFIMYRNDELGTSVQYLPEGVIQGKQLIRVLDMDRLDSRKNPNPDGKFDYIEGYTVQTNTGRIIFPVLEPFGTNLRNKIQDDGLADKYVYQELYDSTLVVAQEMTEKDKFTIKGKYKGTSGNVISLNAMNVPRGSVKVTAGGVTLKENVDYTVDYTMGTVTILNSSIVESGTAVNVSLENQSTFSMQRKSLFGMHAEYTFNPNFSIGATIMHLNEKPLTTKVNTGSEPLSNTIWGANISYRKEFQWLTNLIDKVPWITATQPSSFSINAEVAQLIPGHTKTVSKAGLAYIDDFESTQTSIDIHYPNYWKLSSTPMNDLFPEASLSNDISYGFNRALMSWYAIDQVLVVPQNNTPSHLSGDLDALSDHRVRVVLEQEIFPYKESLATDNSRMSVLNLSFYPEQRGPYNLDTEHMNVNGTLMTPEKRWGGMMRKLDNTDFETSNIEYIEFWMMDPFLTNPDPLYDGGDLYFNLGDVSEDILKDGKKSFEHGLPVNGTDETNIENTVWGRVPKTSSTVIAFSNESGARRNQDVGLNGLSTENEFTNATYSDYESRVRAKVTDPATRSAWEDDPFSPFNDPAGDNYHFYRGGDYDRERKSILERYKYFNGTEGNSPATENSSESYGTASTLEPDIEDINKDNTLNEYEKFYEYKVEIRRAKMDVGTNFITDKITSRVRLANGQTVDVNWYQFKIPIRQYTKRYGNIRNFKSIRFIRMFLTGFSQETHLRLATLDLVRGEWRGYNKDLMPTGMTAVTDGLLDVQAVNYEENSSKSPVNYVLPPGITRQTDPGQAQIIQQNEQAMVLRVTDLAPYDARAVYKNATYDMRNYKKIQMFVHAERMVDEVTETLHDEDLTCFIRLGSDLQNNYYEYEVPLSLTAPGIYSNDRESDRRLVWPDGNMLDFPLSALTNAKRKRNAAKRAGTEGVSNLIPYIVFDDEHGNPQNRVTVMGNPTLGEVEHIMIGVRNRSNKPKSGEIWVNELRLSEYNEEGGWAAMANAQLAISDIGQVNVAGRLETAGYGAIESNVLTRNMEDQYQLSVSTALEAGRLFPEKAKLQIPLYYTYTSNTNSPKYNPLDSDIELSDALDELETKHEKDSLKQLSQTVSKTHNFSASNVRVNIHSKKRNMFYDPANFTFSYSYAQQLDRDPEIQKEQEIVHNGSINYSYDFAPKAWEPFKDKEKLNNPHLKFIKEFNLYYLPQSWSVGTDMHRTFSQLRMRDFDVTGTSQMEPSFSKEWMWNRQFDIKYNLTKNMKFTLQGATNASIDEAKYTPEIIKEYDMSRDYFDRWRDTVRHSLRHGGSPFSYQQVFTASWNVPLNRFPALDWITVNGTYNGTYNWNYIAPSTANGQQLEDMGNEVTSLRTWQVDGQFNFENLYNKSKYLKQVNQRFRSGGNNNNNNRRPGAPNRPFTPKNFNQTISVKAGEPFTLTHRLNSESLNVTFTRNGKPVKLNYKVGDKGKIIITSKTDMDNVEVAIATKDPNQRSAGQNFLDGAMRFLMMIRKAQVTYRASNSLSIDGFKSTPVFMGQQKTGGGNMLAPGVGFALGMFGSNYLEKAKDRGWLASSDSIAKQAMAANTSDFNIKVSLEPIPGLKIDVSAQRYIASTEAIDYMYEGMPSTFTGSYNITQVAIGTAFKKLGNAGNNYRSETYERFLSLRDNMVEKLEQRYQSTNYATTGFMSEDETVLALAGQRYNSSNGGVDVNSGDVLIPAFLAAYTGRSLDKVGRNPFLELKQMMPNWRVTYDGLMMIPWFKKHFQSVTLTHAYTCKYSVGSYTSYSTWVPANDGKDKTLGFVRNVQTGLPTPSSAYDIGSVSITEQFAPLIGLNLTMKNSLSTKFEYKKQRTLSLNVSSTQLIESVSDEFVVGVGYTIKNLNMIIKSKSNRQRKISNDLKLSADFSYKDIKSLLRKIQENVTQASSGNKVFSIKIAADYVISSKVNLQAYYERQATTPLISTSYPVTVSDFGVNLRLMLTR